MKTSAFAYLYFDKDLDGLACTIYTEDNNFDCFEFYVHNGEWRGGFYNGKILIHADSSSFDDHNYTVELDFKKMPEFAKNIAIGMLTGDKDLYNKSRGLI